MMRNSIGAAFLLLMTGMATACGERADDRAGTAGASEVRVTLNEWTVQLDPSTVQAGDVVFRVTNSGQYTHRLEIEGNDSEWETGDIAPGGQATLRASLRSGRYEAYCPIDDEHGVHRDRGMTTSLTVP